MKRTFTQLTLAIGLAIISAGFAQAQTGSVYRAEVPFDFTVGTRSFSAGTYMVEVRGAQQKHIILRDSKGERSYAAITTPGKKGDADRAFLDFQRVGGDYSLRSIRVRDIGSSYPQPKFNERLARNEEPTTVTVRLTSGK